MREVTRVQWGPVITGAFCALATGIVLGLFGAAFGLGGLTVLSGVWQVVTPLVATAVGALVAVSMTGRGGAYLNGIMVWCVALVAGALMLAGFGAFGSARSAEIATQGAATRAALSGLAAILGLIGAVIGSAVGALASARLAGIRPSRTAGAAGGERHVEETVKTTPPVYRAPASDSPEAMRH